MTALGYVKRPRVAVDDPVMAEIRAALERHRGRGGGGSATVHPTAAPHHSRISRTSARGRCLPQLPSLPSHPSLLCVPLCCAGVRCRGGAVPGWAGAGVGLSGGQQRWGRGGRGVGVVRSSSPSATTSSGSSGSRGALPRSAAVSVALVLSLTLPCSTCSCLIRIAVVALPSGPSCRR